MAGCLSALVSTVAVAAQEPQPQGDGPAQAALSAADGEGSRADWAVDAAAAAAEAAAAALCEGGGEEAEVARLAAAEAEVALLVAHFEANVALREARDMAEEDIRAVAAEIYASDHAPQLKFEPYTQRFGWIAY